MERLLNSSVEKQTIYEIFRACRLCGGGAGYKMPIIQNVVDLEGSEVELKQKIKECVHIEVHQDDKMPPLICELCVDKVNDFYEFLDMCRQINKRTRLRLGLPPQAMPQETPDADDCILGVTEPVFVNDDSDEPLSKQKSKTKPNDKVKKEETVKSKKEPELRVKVEKHIPRFIPSNHISSGRFVRSSKRLKSPSPKDVSNESSKKLTNNDDISLARLKAQKRVPRVVITKGILKKENKIDDSLLVPRLKKRLRERTPPKPLVPKKKVKLSTKPEPPKPVLKQSPRVTNKMPPRPILRSSSDSKISSNLRTSTDSRTSSSSRTLSNSRTSSDSKTSSESKPSSNSKASSDSKISLRSIPKSAPKTVSKVELRPMPKPVPKPAPKRAPSPPPLIKCTICKQQFKTPQSVISHMKIHTASITSDRLACNACQEWFKNVDEATAHHKNHARGKRYHCTRCFSDFKVYQGYLDHIKETCIPLYEVPDVQCHKCWKYFPTDNLRDQHDCPGEDGRPGGKCEHCKRTYATVKSLKKHEGVCSSKKKVFVLDPVLKSKLRPVRVRTARCDPLLTNSNNDRYNVSDIDQDFGLDKTYTYPFRTRNKPKFQGMVKFNDDFDFENMYVHWDSDDSEGSSDTELSDSVSNPLIKRKNIDKLSTLSLKTIFSHRFLGKVPRKRRKLKFSETNCNTNRENVDKIIKNLDCTEDKEEQSGSIDSEENRAEHVKTSSDNIKSNDDTIKDIRNDEIEKEDNDNISKPKAKSEVEKYSENKSCKSAADGNEKSSKIICSSNEMDVIGQEIEQTNAAMTTCNNENTMEIDENTESKKIKETNRISAADSNTTKTDQDKNETNNIKGTNEISADSNEKTNSNISHTKQKEESIEYNKNKIGDNKVINSSEELKEKESTDCIDTCQVKNHSLTYEKDNVSMDNSIINESNKQLDTSYKKEANYAELTQKNGEIKTPEEKCQNSTIISNEINSNTKKTDDEEKSSVKICKNVEVKEKQILESEALKSEIDVSKNSVCDVNKDIEKLSSDVSISVNGDTNDESVENVDDECDIEMDDQKLMEELDAQIGENDNNKNVECEKIQTENEVPTKKDQSMDLESISDDEFNF